MTFDPMSVEVTCVTLPKDHCVQVQWQYINVCGYSDQFCKLPHTTYVLHTYYVHTTYRMSDHIVSCWTQFRRDKNYGTIVAFDTLLQNCELVVILVVITYSYTKTSLVKLTVRGTLAEFFTEVLQHNTGAFWVAWFSWVITWLVVVYMAGWVVWLEQKGSK